MNIRTELSEFEEIVIRCREINDCTRSLELLISEAINRERDLLLLSSGSEHLIPKKDILFFESCDKRVYAHTAERVYSAPYKLFELEEIMPSCFIRVSKSVIANVKQISSLHREFSGGGEITFRGSDKTTYFSRAYHKLLQHKINEMRL